MKLSAVPPEIRQFEGPASVFEEEDEAIKGLGTGAIKRGQVIVLRNMGPKAVRAPFSGLHGGVLAP